MLENNSNGRSLNEIENKKVVGLKGMAYKDYVAARLLLQNDMLHQAAFLINTCIEKELKAYLFASGISVKRNHDTEKLIDRVSQIESVNWVGDINLDFIKVINKIYESRYFETLEPGYNFVINRNKFLAELDYTYSLLHSKSFKVDRQQNPIKSMYQISVENKDPLVYKNNYVLINRPKEELLDKRDLVHEFRVTEENGIIEMIYSITKNEDYKKFNYEGLKQINDKQFTMSQTSENP